MGRHRKPAGAAKPRTKPSAVATKHARKNRAEHTTTMCGIRMTLRGGTTPTPRDPVLSGRADMQTVQKSADVTSVDEPDRLVLKSGVAVNGARCEVDGDNCVVNGDHCTVNGDDCVVNGAFCVVRGKGAVVAGKHCTVASEGLAKEVSGAHCTIRGIVLAQTGPDFRLEGGTIGTMAVRGGTARFAVARGAVGVAHSSVGVQTARGGIVNFF